MKAKIAGAAIGWFLFLSLQAQDKSVQPYKNFPVVLTLQFHSLSMPFKNLLSNFSNIGIGVGTEVSLNDKDNWLQQFTIMWYNNRATGNGIFMYTQNAWRPTIKSNAYAEVKAGVGYLYSFRPTKSFKQVNNEWQSVGRRGKGMFSIPVGVTIGYNHQTTKTYYSPFLSYQFLLVSGYNQSIPVVPQTLIQIGSRIH
jgi:hypothetical protein